MNITKAMEILELEEKDVAQSKEEFPKHDISYVEGIGEKNTEKFKKIGINNTAGLLLIGAKRKGREVLARKMGIEASIILTWVNHCDLYRIKGVGADYGELLEESGVDTVIELSKRVPENLYNKMIEINEQKKLVKALPSLEDIEEWIEEAKQMPRIIEY